MNYTNTAHHGGSFDIETYRKAGHLGGSAKVLENRPGQADGGRESFELWDAARRSRAKKAAPRGDARPEQQKRLASESEPVVWLPEPKNAWRFQCLRDIAPENVRWLWPERFVRNGINLLAGMPDVGKSIFLSTVAACVTTGCDWPDGAKGCEPGDVFISETEDEYASTVVPRLMAAGADMARCYRMQDGLTPRPEDLDGFSLFIPSPALSLMRGGKDHNNEIDVREQLARWIESCRITNCCLIAPAHYNKKSDQAALHRLLGSQAFGAMPRSVYCIEKDKDDPNPHARLFLKLKSNLTPEKSGLRFRTENIGPWSQSVTCIFSGETEVHADDVVGKQPSRLGDTEAKVLNWLKEHPSAMGYHYKEIGEALEMNPATCRDKLASLAKKNAITRCGLGTYKHP